MEFSNVFTEGLLCVRLGGFQWLKEKNKVPNPQGAYILMWERKILKEFIPGNDQYFENIKWDTGVKGNWGLG